MPLFLRRMVVEEGPCGHPPPMPSHDKEVHSNDDDLICGVENYIQRGETDTQVQPPEVNLPLTLFLPCAWFSTRAGTSAGSAGPSTSGTVPLTNSPRCVC